MSKVNQKKLKKLIDKFQYISFDIFDTLITRNLSTPSELFDIVERKYNNTHKEKLLNFKKMRIEAENIARDKSKYEEITFDEIYDNLPLSNNIQKDLKRIEIETEIEICEINRNYYKIYEYAKSQKKKILITSDMYLPTYVVEKILINNNISFSKLYVSSALRMTKRTKTLFKYILESCKIKENELLHIGDSFRSDYINPKMLGIKSYQVKNLKENLKHYNSKIKFSLTNEENFIYEYICNFINNHIDNSKDYYWQTGYEVFGPLLLGYVKWLNEQFESENINNIFFLSRDGFIMKKAYELINKNNNCHYIYGSRRALVTPTIWMYPDFYKSLSENIFPEHTEIKINKLLQRSGLNPNKYVNLLHKYGLNFDDYIYVKKIDNNSYNFLHDIKDDILNNSKEEYTDMLNYFKQNGIKDKIAIIDIGWYGLMQKAICKICEHGIPNTIVYGYYTGIYPKSPNQNILNMKGYLFSKDDDALYNFQKYFNPLYELFFSTNHGSVKKYNSTREMVELMDYEYEGTDTWNKVNLFQNGAISFINEFIKTPIYKSYYISNKVAFYNYAKLGNDPLYSDIKEIGNLDFYDYELTKIISSKNIGYYVFHPKRFMNDFKRSLWKPAFLKKIFKVNINYYKLVLIINKYYDRRKK